MLIFSFLLMIAVIASQFYRLNKTKNDLAVAEKNGDQEAVKKLTKDKNLFQVSSIVILVAGIGMMIFFAIRISQIN